MKELEEGLLDGISDRCGAEHRRAADLIRTCSLICCGILASLLLVMCHEPASADEYRLGARDKVSIKVVEWRAGKGEYHEWDGLSGDYTIAMSGMLQLPLLGELPARGKTTGELARSISDGLQARVGMINRPDTSVQVQEFRPIYVVGEVEKPGEYSYRPEISILQAVGLAGGLRRIADVGLLRLERDRITAQGSLETARNELRRAYVRRARVQAELAGSDEIAISDEMRRDPKLVGMISGEKLILAARQQAFHAQVKGLKDLRELFLAEVESLGKKIDVQTKQVALSRQELANVGTLVQKGLAVSSREFALERTTAEIESRLLDFEMASLKAKQSINETDQKISDIESTRNRDLMAELQQLESNIEQISIRTRTALDLLSEATLTAPLIAAERWSGDSDEVSYTIVRRVEGRAKEIEADELSIVAPDDVIRVTRKRSNTTSFSSTEIYKLMDPNDALAAAINSRGEIKADEGNPLFDVPVR